MYPVEKCSRTQLSNKNYYYYFLYILLFMFRSIEVRKVTDNINFEKVCVGHFWLKFISVFPVFSFWSSLQSNYYSVLNSKYSQNIETVLANYKWLEKCNVTTVITTMWQLRILRPDCQLTQSATVLREVFRNFTLIFYHYCCCFLIVE